MATTFLEPGGDADFTPGRGVNTFWPNGGGTPILATDFVHGNHIKSIGYALNSSNFLITKDAVLADAGSRISFYIYIAALPTSLASMITIATAGASASIIRLYVTTGGVLQLWRGAAVVQMGSNGSTLSTGIWYRISIAYTIASSTVNEFRIFKDGVLDITASNTASLTTASSVFRIGNHSGDLTFDFRSSDHYADNSNTLTDTGNIWVTAKRPNANGTTNGFTTQIGAGGSGYGSGHSPQVNERALSITNGWSMVGAGAAVTEEYNIESKSTGDIDISTATIVDWLGWISVKALAGTPTIQIILDGANNAQAINTTATLYTKIKGSSTYPSGTGADIGMVTDTSLTTESLYECGVVVAYIPAVATVKNLALLGVG